MHFRHHILCFMLWTAACACPAQMDGNISTIQYLKLSEQGSCLFRSILPSDTTVLVLVCVSVVMTIIALKVNAFLLLGLKHSEDFSWKPRFALLKNLIVSDVLLIITQGPTIIYCLLKKTTLMYGVWCLTQLFINTMCVFCTVFTVTCMAWERYLYVCWGINYLNILTAKRINLIVGLMWFISVSSSVVITGLHTLGHKPSLLEKPTTGLLCEPDTKGITYQIIITLFCVLSCFFPYLRMFQNASNIVQPFQQFIRKACKTVVFYYSMLLLQLLPILLKILSDVLWELEGAFVMQQSLNFAESDWTSAGTIHIMLVVMLQVPPFINPLIYRLHNKEVRNVLNRLQRWYNNM